MQDKSSYTSPNKPQITQGLQDFINAMVEEIVFKGESFEKSKKWLKKYSESDGMNYVELEKNLQVFFEFVGDYQKTQLASLKRIITSQAEICFVSNDILEKIQFNAEASQKKVEEINEPLNIKKPIDVKAPSLDSNNTQVKIAKWLVSDGDYVFRNSEIAEIESNKATLSLCAFEDGIIKFIVEVGDTVDVGSIIATIDTSAK